MGVEFRIEILAAGSNNKATCLRLTHDSISILLDVGFSVLPAHEFDLPDESPDLALITHAHLGHGGGLFAATSAWPETVFWAASPTFQIMGTQFRHADNHLGVNIPLTDCYRWIEVPFGNTVDVHAYADISVTFWPCGHMCGAALPVIEWDGYRIAYWVDWTAYPYGGNPGLSSAAISNCDLFITHLPKSQVLSSVSGVSIAHVLGSDATTVLIAAQPVGAAQEILSEMLAFPELHRRWTLHIDTFTYEVSQYLPVLATVFKTLDWRADTMGTRWLSSSNEGFSSTRNLFIGGTACLWPDSPSFEIARKLMDAPHTLICLGDDVIPLSPAHCLWRMREPQMLRDQAENSTHTSFRKIWEMDAIRSDIQKLALAPRKMSCENTLEWVRATKPKHLIVFGENRHLANTLDCNDSIVMDEGDAWTGELPHRASQIEG
jgi:hypothetical protein